MVKKYFSDFQKKTDYCEMMRYIVNVTPGTLLPGGVPDYKMGGIK